RNGATPARIVTGVVVLGADTATTLPCRLGDDQPIHHYILVGRKKSEGEQPSADGRDVLSTVPEATTEADCFHKFCPVPIRSELRHLVDHSSGGSFRAHSRNLRNAAPRWLYCAFSSALSSAKVFAI